MSQHKLLKRRSEILKKQVSRMILKENRDGLTRQDALLKRRIIKELHHTSYDLKSI